MNPVRVDVVEFANVSYSYTPTLTRLLFHVCSYTPTHTLTRLLCGPQETSMRVDVVEFANMCRASPVWVPLYFTELMTGASSLNLCLY